jgi:hypothetical protein
MIISCMNRESVVILFLFSSVTVSPFLGSFDIISKLVCTECE